MSEQTFWIIGDNILECERALEVIAASLGDESVIQRLDGPPYAPTLRVTSSEFEFDFQLFPGHGRWQYELADHLKALGAPLREAADAVLVAVEPSGEEVAVEPILAFEFCGALPAGNNAWQRCGRAVALAEARVPYLYFAELGGIEMGPDRVAKAARFPNPIVPFAYLALGETAGTIAMPVFDRSPSMPPSLLDAFEGSFGTDEAKAIIRDILTGAADPQPAIEALEQKGVAVVRALSEGRRRVDTLRGEEWDQLANESTGPLRAAYLLERGLTWRKRTSIAVTTTFRPLIALAVEHGAAAAGATEIPICVLPGATRGDFAAAVRSLYEGRIDEEFLEWLSEDRPLVMVWIAGFKPRGDDSRPDRGLMPLARMIFGRAVDYLAVIYGPGSADTWNRFDADLSGLARTNGLWEAVVGLSDGILIDSLTAATVASTGRLTGAAERDPPPHERHRITASRQAPRIFGEHDVDAVLHVLFAAGLSPLLFESMCNPPGGDWSGLSFQESVDGDITRWTSLPRVTAPGSKRPDHVVLLREGGATAFAIESKDAARAVEDAIGPRLVAYVNSLLDVAPNIQRQRADAVWSTFAEDYTRADTVVLSGVAFAYARENLAEVSRRADVDLVIGAEFLRDEERVLLHVAARTAAERFAAELSEVAANFEGRIEVHIDRLDHGV
jgi:hypothetical protein